MEGQHFTRLQAATAFKAAGVLPITVHQNEALCLLGGELKRTGPEGKFLKTMWSDFGGGREALDYDVHACAGREFAEETLGLFGGCNVDAAAVDLSAKLMAEQLRNKYCALEVVHQLKKGKYHMFVAATPYIDPLMFHLAAQQNSTTMAVSGAEKTKFAWLPLAEVLKAVSRAAPRYHVHARPSSGCSSEGWMVGHAATRRRLQLHPCFASSLRLAQAAGLEQLAASLNDVKLPRQLSPAGKRKCSPLPSKTTNPSCQQSTSVTPGRSEANPGMLLYWLQQEEVAACWHTCTPSL